MITVTTSAGHVATFDTPEDAARFCHEMQRRDARDKAIFEELVAKVGPLVSTGLERSESPPFCRDRAKAEAEKDQPKTGAAEEATSQEAAPESATAGPTAARERQSATVGVDRAGSLAAPVVAAAPQEPAKVIPVSKQCDFIGCENKAIYVPQSIALGELDRYECAGHLIEQALRHEAIAADLRIHAMGSKTSPQEPAKVALSERLLKSRDAYTRGATIVGWDLFAEDIAELEARLVTAERERDEARAKLVKKETR